MFKLKRNDADIKAEVIRELELDPNVIIANLKVTVSDGEVMLEGEADSYGAKLEAEEAPYLVPGVHGVENKLTVVLSEAHLSPDAELAREVRTRLALDQVVPSDSITVEVYYGVVTLGGKVEWPYQIEAAQKDIANIRGIREIQNYVTVVHPYISGAEVEVRIAIAFARRRKLLDSNVMAAVDGSEVTLLGTVATSDESDLALAVAQKSPGVTHVTNNLIITSEQH